MTVLTNATVLITGAGGGFGRELTRQAAARGATLIISDLNEQTLTETATLAPEAITQCITADLSTAEGCRHLYETCHTMPDILVNNAGLAMFGRYTDVPTPAWERLMAVNVMAPMRLVQHFLPALIERGSGHLVTLSSMAGWVGTKGLAPYTASKYAVRGFADALREEVAEHGIHVTTVYPFYSRTPMLDDSPRYGDLYEPPMPDGMVSDPADVIAATLKGIERNAPHVFPDAAAKRLHLIKRFAPWLIPILFKQLEGYTA